MDTVCFDSKAEQWDAHRSRVQRAENIYNTIASRIIVHRGDTVLDFGCGTGLLGFHFAKAVKAVTFADTSAAMLDQVHKKAAAIRDCTIKTVNLAEDAITETYTVIVSLMALHHVADLNTAIGNLAAHVAKGGFICLSDLDVEDGSFHYPDTAPHNGIDRSIVIETICKSGMQVIFNQTVHIEEKIIDGNTRTYPVFLIIGKRE